MTRVAVPIAGAGAELMIDAYLDKLERRPGDCGVDLYPTASGPSDIQVKQDRYFDILSIPTDVSIAVPEGHFAWVVGRSSSYDKLMGCEVISGIIDHGYTGECRIRVRVPRYSWDRTLSPMIEMIAAIVEYGEKRVALAQVIIIPFAGVVFNPREKLEETARGSQGYGSTDAKLVEEIDQVFAGSKPTGGTSLCAGACGKPVMVHQLYCAQCSGTYDRS